ncbi:MAG: hypothetical protein LBP35_05455 [Candidatus Ancillula trichonymphae]|nr:hypothetical protein [Candidatus Ancillula trichonymphae]
MCGVVALFSFSNCTSSILLLVPNPFGDELLGAYKAPLQESLRSTLPSAAEVTVLDSTGPAFSAVHITAGGAPAGTGHSSAAPVAGLSLVIVNCAP